MYPIRDVSILGCIQFGMFSFWDVSDFGSFQIEMFLNEVFCIAAHEFVRFAHELLWHAHEFVRSILESLFCNFMILMNNLMNSPVRCSQIGFL